MGDGGLGPRRRFFTALPLALVLVRAAHGTHNDGDATASGSSGGPAASPAVDRDGNSVGEEENEE